MRTAPCWLALGCLGGLLAAGCSNQPRLVPVSGKLTMNGKPLRNVRVDFHPDPEKGTRGEGSSGTTDDSGNFTLTQSAGKSGVGKPGAIVGHHRVIFTDLDPYGTVFVGRGDYRSEDKEGKSKEVPKKPRFAALYTSLEQTPFKAEVKPDMAPLAIDLK